MIRHPHFTQPIFVRFPRPAVMAGRLGAEQYPQGGEVSLEAAVYRSLRERDSTVTLQAVEDAIGLHDEADVLRALVLTLKEGTGDALGTFRARLPKRITQSVQPRPQVAALRGGRNDDPYGA
jgi:hypothetical protein